MSGEFTFNPFAQEPGTVQVGPGLREGTIPAGANLPAPEPVDAEPQDAVPADDGQGDAQDAVPADDGDPEAPQPQTKVLTKPEPRKAATGRTPRAK